MDKNNYFFELHWLNIQTFIIFWFCYLFLEMQLLRKDQYLVRIMYNASIYKLVSTYVEKNKHVLKHVKNDAYNR